MSDRGELLETSSVRAERRFAWQGIELDGRRRRGVLVAVDAAAARARLRRRNVVVLALAERGKAPRPKASQREVTGFTRQLAGLLHAGVPLAQALDLIAQASAAGGMARIAEALARGITDGTRFAAALSSFPVQFDAFYCQLAAVGEASGSLAATLARLAEERERAADLRAKARAALAYPMAVLLFAIAVTAALLVWVVPTFRQVFESFGSPLPAPTRLVIAISEALAEAGAALAAAIAAVYLLTARLVRTSRRTRLALHEMALAAPIVGPICTALAVARFCRALGTLLAAGTPLAEALGSLTQTTGNAHFDRAGIAIAARLARGERLAAAIRAVGRFPRSIVETIAIAEESGALDMMLLDMASLAEREARQKLALLTALAEPVVVVVLGALVGGLVVALYLPVIELGNVV
jgi:type IV pilus assembly protein PilC